MSEDNDLLAQKLLKVAKADVKASRLLYDNGLHPQSYFYFQQATEKATKAFFLLCNLSNPKKTFNTRHNLFKLHSITLAEAGKDNKLALDVLKVFPFLKATTVMKDVDIKKNINDINMGLRFFGSLDQYDLINISVKDIKKFLQKIDSVKIKYHGIQAPQDLTQRIDRFFSEFITEIEKDDSAKAKYLADSVRQTLANADVGNIIREHFSDIIESIFETSYAYVVLYFSSYLTIQHSVLSRYPDSLKNPKTPFQIYNKKLPLVKYQPLFLDHLRSAILGIEKLI